MSRLFAAPGAPDLPTSQPPGANEGDTHEFSSSSGPELIQAEGGHPALD